MCTTVQICTTISLRTTVKSNKNNNMQVSTRMPGKGLLNVLINLTSIIDWFTELGAATVDCLFPYPFFDEWQTLIKLTPLGLFHPESWR